jgi:glycosyltransferase involved in cell wall biosynthesis
LEALLDLNRLLPLEAMIIAVNTRFLLGELEGYGYFIHELFRVLVTKQSEHQFYFLFDRPFNKQFIFSSNVHPIVVSPAARHPVLWKYWYDVKVAFALKKIKADVFVSPDGFCSLTTTVPQCLIIHDLGFLNQPETYKRSHVGFYKRNTPKFLRKAKYIVTVSQFSKNHIVKQYKTDPAKIAVVYNGVKDVFNPRSVSERETIKEKYTEGREYFIYIGAIQPRKNLVNLLKAFSIFKKRLQSNMKLVIAGRLAWKNEEFLELIKTYKYRSDVVLTGYLPEEELSAILSSAYALVYPSLFEGFGVPVVEAMKCEVPVLTSEKTSMEEAAGDAALYFNPNNYQDIADKMMLIYKDENLRKQLIEKGKLNVVKYSWEKSAELFWECILRTMKMQ